MKRKATITLEAHERVSKEQFAELVAEVTAAMARQAMRFFPDGALQVKAKMEPLEPDVLSPVRANGRDAADGVTAAVTADAVAEQLRRPFTNL